MFLLYRFLTYLLSLIASPFLVVTYWLDWQGMRERLGEVEKSPSRERDRPLWIHAASVGEVNGIRSLIHTLQQRYPDLPLVVSTTTLTGRSQAQKHIDGAGQVFLAPLDFPWAVHRTLRRVGPRLLVLAETELWPNLVVQARHRGCRLLLVNGRISDRSYPRYRWIRRLCAPLLQQFALLAVQTERDGERLLTLGAPRERLVVMGNMKFDGILVPEKTAEYRRMLHLAPSVPVIVAGSIRSGEETLLFQAFFRLRQVCPEARLICAPRYLEHAATLAACAQQWGFIPLYRTALDTVTNNQSDVIILDTIGELGHIYSIAQIAIVGGSLLSEYRGHNLLEPAAYGVPVLFGPYRETQRESAELLLASGGGIEVTDGEDLGRQLTALLGDPEQRRRMGQQARRVVSARQGVAARVVERLAPLLSHD